MICPYCGVDDPKVYLGFNSVECVNAACKHYVAVGSDYLRLWTASYPLDSSQAPTHQDFEFDIDVLPPTICDIGDPVVEQVGLSLRHPASESTLIQAEASLVEIWKSLRNSCGEVEDKFYENVWDFPYAYIFVWTRCFVPTTPAVCGRANSCTFNKEVVMDPLFKNMWFPA